MQRGRDFDAAAYPGSLMPPAITRHIRAGLVACAIATIAPYHQAVAQNQQTVAQDTDQAAAFARRIDPTDFKHRFDLRNEYYDLPGGAYTNLLVPRGEYAFTRALSLRVELPIVTYSSGAPGTNTDTGIGNLVTRMAWRAARTDRYAVVVGTEVMFDTASKDNLGQGKNVIAPLAFVAIELPQFNSIFFPYIQHYRSVSGDDARPDIHYTNPRLSLLTRYPKRTYTFVESSFFIDHEHSDRVGATLRAELGRFFTPNTGLYVRPGVGLYRNDLPQVFNWGLDVGMRHLF
jgi:hypothetical protein